MKQIFTLLMLFLLYKTGIMAQMPVIINEDSLRFGSSMIPCLSVTIPEAPYDKTLKAWINILESGTKSKVVSENNDLTIFGAKLKKISPDPVNVYSRLTSQDSILVLFAAFEMRKDQYIEKATAEKELAQAEYFLKDFAKDQYLDVVKEQVNAEEKKLRSIEKELKSLEKDKSSRQKSIHSSRNLITDENDNLTVQNNELSSVSSAIIGLNNELSSMDDSPERDAKIGVRKELEKRKKKALKSIKASENRISKAENNIRKNEREIPRNEDNQEIIKEKFDIQDKILQSYIDKLNAVKRY